MQMFRSEWLREPRYAARDDARAAGFAPRYGVRVERDLPAPRLRGFVPERIDTAERERAVLWEIARYDRAA